MTGKRWPTYKRVAVGGMMLAAMTWPGVAVAGQESHWVDQPLPNPTGEVILNWAPLPDGREWGSTAGIDIGPDGHVWAYDRCGGGLDGGCDANPDLDPIFKFHKDTGEILTSFGAGLFVTPHGFHVDADGNVWATDFAGNEAGTKGHQVIKFSPEGEVLMRLGEAGVAGSGPGQLNQPCDVITAPNGDIFVSDGHSGQSPDPPDGATGRILKFDSEGNFIKEWGEIGFRPGQFRTPHAMEFDSRGRLFVADRGNHRIQIFSQDGELLDTYVSYGRISGLFISDDDTLYAIDSESGVGNHPGWKTGIRIGPADEDRLTGFVPPHAHATRVLQGVAGEGVAVDDDGNIYAAEGPGSRPTAGGGITKYVATSTPVASARARIVGTYRMVGRRTRQADGTWQANPDFNALGYITYSDRGYMGVHVMPRDRTPFAGSQPTADEAQAALQGYAAYFGPFSTHEDEDGTYLIHHRVGQIVPGGEVDAKRYYDFEGDRLVLTPAAPDGSKRHATRKVVWERVPNIALSDEATRFVGVRQLLYTDRYTLRDGELASHDQRNESRAGSYIIYTPSGHMMVHLMAKEGRTPYAGETPTPEEALATYRSYGGYFGRFTVHEDADPPYVVHHIEGRPRPSSPNDTDRIYQLDGDILRLGGRPRETDGDVMAGGHLYWERLPERPE